MTHKFEIATIKKKTLLTEIDTVDVSVFISLRFQIVVLLLLWLNINSGYWNMRDTGTYMEMLHAFRGAMPYLLMPLGFFLRTMRPRVGGKYNPVLWLEIYGWIVLFASLLSPHFTAAFYFGLAYLANIYIPQLFLARREIKGERVLLYITWISLVVCVVGIAFVAGDKLFTGYGITGFYKDGVGGMAMSRSSGIARFFGIAGLLALCRFWGGSSFFRWIWLLPVSAGAMIVWSMQSRGAMFGLAAGVLLLLTISRASKMIYMLIAVVMVTIYAGEYEEALFKTVGRQVMRGQDSEQFESMSGRTNTYKKAVKVIAENPFLGQGNWADRLTIKEHVHNSYLQALMNGGIIGFIPYMLSWIMGWRLFFLLQKKMGIMETADRMLFLEASTMMAFFTVQSVPETTTASFSVASLAMVPVYIFMAALYERLSDEEERSSILET